MGLFKKFAIQFFLTSILTLILIFTPLLMLKIFLTLDYKIIYNYEERI